MNNAMIAVANHTSGQAGGLKRCFVAALLKHLILKGVAFRADIVNAVHARGSCAMVAMAGGAGWRAESPRMASAL